MEEALKAFVLALLIEHGLLEDPDAKPAAKGGKPKGKPAKEDDEIDLDKLKELCTALVEAKGKKALVDLLKKAKAEKLGDLDEKNYKKFAAAVTEATGVEDDKDDLFD